MAELINKAPVWASQPGSGTSPVAWNALRSVTPTSISPIKLRQVEVILELTPRRTGQAQVRADRPRDRDAGAPGKDFPQSSAQNWKLPAGRRLCRQPGRIGMSMRRTGAPTIDGRLYDGTLAGKLARAGKGVTSPEISMSGGETGRWFALQQGDHDQRRLIANPRSTCARLASQLRCDQRRIGFQKLKRRVVKVDLCAAPMTLLNKDAMKAGYAI